MDNNILASPGVGQALLIGGSLHVVKLSKSVLLSQKRSVVEVPYKRVCDASCQPGRNTLLKK